MGVSVGPGRRVGQGVVIETYHISIEYEADVDDRVGVIDIELVKCLGKPDRERVEDVEANGGR